MTTLTTIIIILVLFVFVSFHWIREEATEKVQMPLYLITTAIAVICFVLIFMNLHLCR